MFCGWTQWRISNALDDGGTLPASVQKHLLTCPNCREFYKRCLQVEQALTESARDASSATPAPLLERFAETAIRSSSSPVSRKPYYPWAALAAAAALMIAASVMVPLLRNGKPTAPPTVVYNDPVSAFQSLVREVRPVGAPLPASAAQWQSYLSQPYQKELNLMARDTDSAVKFVASCVGVDLSNRTIVPEMNF